MGYYNELTLEPDFEGTYNYTPRTASAPWACALCGDTDRAHQSPTRPTHCTACPDLRYDRWTTRAQIVIKATRDGATCGLWHYQRNAAGMTAADRKVARLVADGYTAVMQ